MKDRRLIPLALALAFSFSNAAPAFSEGPTPTPKARRKLGGGSFGQPPGKTPTPGTQSSGSLADVVRKTQDEAAVPGAGGGRGIVITNESLQKPERAGAGPGATVTITGTAGSKASAKARPTPIPTIVTVPEYRDSSGRTEADWRARAKAVREKVERTDAELGTALAEARRLENDFYAWSDSNYRERVIRPAWDQAKEKLASFQAEAEKARGEMAALEDEARKAGAPPGWLR